MAAASPSSTEKDIDIYSDLGQNDEELASIAEANELFDAVLTGSVDRDKKVGAHVSSQSKERPAPVQNKPTALIPYRRLSLYIGSFPWWTSDNDLLCMARTLGVQDVKEIKFAENKVNGQSRGYAEVVVTSEESLRILLQKAPLCKVNGEVVDCRSATRQNLVVFEDVANKRFPPRVSYKDPKGLDCPENVPSLLSQAPSPAGLPTLFPSHPIANRFPSAPSPFLGQPPPPFPHFPPNMSHPPPPLFPPHPFHLSSQPSSSLHLNPAFFSPAQDRHSSPAHPQPTPTPQRGDKEFEDLLNRNRAVASSAITKAVTGATSGDLQVAMETLVTAIGIIKQSRVYGDERCQAMVTSLMDCLVSIQRKGGYRSHSGDRDRGRARNRERDREDSSSRESAGTSRRHRERSRSGERDKERSRERARHRVQRDRYR